MNHRSRDDASLPPLRLISIAWGDSYVNDYLEFCLSAIQAPGNLPALLAQFSCEVVLVTESRYFDQVRAHPSYKAAVRLCPVRLIALDDLVATRGSYGMSITYAFYRGFEDLGPRMTDCALVFLHADFIPADNSLGSLAAPLLRGERLIFAPSYCTIAAHVKPQLRALQDRTRPVLAVEKRAMAQLILANRHNTIRAKTVNQRFFHMQHMDQFYWAVDESTLLGHQLPIAVVAMRPERYLQDVTSYWDYGVIADFCPSMKFLVLGDSDEFVMMELRDRDTASKLLRLGWPTLDAIAAGMKAMVTEYTKLLGRAQLTLHARDLPLKIAEERQQLADYLHAVYAKLPENLDPHLGHPQWKYHHAVFHKARERVLIERSTSRRSERAEASQDTVSPLDESAIAQVDMLTASLAEETRLTSDTRLEEVLTTIKYERSGQKLLEAPDKRPPFDGPVGRESKCGATRHKLVARMLRTNAEDICSRLEEETAKRRLELEVAVQELAARRREFLRVIDEVAEGYEESGQIHVRGIGAIGGMDVPTFEALPMQQSDGLAKRISAALFGSAPEYRPWHWMHSRSRLGVGIADQYIVSESRVLFLHNTKILNRIVERSQLTVSAPVGIVGYPAELYEKLGKQSIFDCCVVEADVLQLPKLRRIFEAVRPLIIDSGRFVAVFFNNSNNPLPFDHELIRDTFPACGPARMAYTGCWASVMAAEIRLRFQRAMAGRIGFSLAYALALSATAPLALASSLLEKKRTMENSHNPGKWVTGVTVEIDVG